MVLQQLEMRFRPLPQAAVQAVSSMSEEQLRTIVSGVLDAASLTDLGLPDA